jgi:copper transport protein
MSDRGHSGSRRAAVAVALSLAAFMVSAVRAGPADAHATLVRTDPAFGMSLAVAPDTVRLVFDEEVAADLSSVELIGARTGSLGRLHVVAAGPDVLTVDLPRLRRDLYRLAWRTVAADDLHATSGTVVFGVRTAAAGSALAGQPVDPTSPAAPEVAVRWLDFVAIALLVGSLAVALFVLPVAARKGAGDLDPLRRPVLGLAMAGGLCACLTGVALLLIQDARAGGLSALGRILGDTSYGGYWAVRQGILLDLVVVVAALRRGHPRPALRWAAAVLAAALMLPLALVSHAAAIEGAGSAATFVMALHLLAAALWVGGVVALCLACGLLLRAGLREPARLVALSFGSYAVVCVAVIAITGVASLGLHVRSLDALVHTSYGDAMLVKAALFLLAGLSGLIVTVGLRWRRGGRLGSAWAAVPRLEAALLVAVLAPAALMTASAPARNVPIAQATTAPSAATEKSAGSDDLLFDFRVEPARPGMNFITVGVYQTRRPAPAPVRAVTLRVKGPGTAARSVALVAAGPDRWQTTERLPAGRFRLEAAVSRPGLARTLAATPLTVARAAAAPAPQGGWAQRPLEPILRPLSVAAALLFAAVMVLRRELRWRPGIGRHAMRSDTS